jgi:hypothetical protein
MSQSNSAVITSSHSPADSATTYIGLTKAALDLINSSNPVNKLANNIIKWLGRERIDQSDFQYCVEQSRALAHPNEDGLNIRENILKSDNRVAKLGGLQLIIPGAIGRWMAFSQDHAYMVTTFAAVTKYQSTLFANDVLCEMIMAGLDGPPKEEKYYFSYSVDRARLKGVLSKICNSILLNVVNAGHTLGDLPSEFQPLCVHLVDAGTYARAVLKISKSNADILLLCDRFQGDLLLWVLAHFEGSIEVSVAGKQIFSKAAQHGKRRFIMIVKNICKEGDNCREHNRSVELSELLGGKWIRILDGSDDCSMKISTSQRLPLYATVPPHPSRNRDILNREETLKVKHLAQKLVFWILEVPLQKNPHFTTIGFGVAFSLEPEEVKLRVGDILYRWPRILQEASAKSRNAFDLAFKQPESRERQGSDIYYEPILEPVSALCDCFPAILDLLDAISERCNCRICRNNGVIDDCREGCLRNAAINHLFMLVGNAIADGFGVQEVSGIIDLPEYVYEVRKLVTTLAVDGLVWWDHWFNVAASTALGYVPKGVLGTNDLDDDGGGSLMAVQYGASVVAAKWLDLTKRITPNQCFALEMVEGQIPGTQGDCTFVYSEAKMELHCDLNDAIQRRSGESNDAWVQKVSDRDQTQISIGHAMIGMRDNEVCRLITVVSTETSQRIINPGDAVSGALRSYFMDSATLDCQHRTGSQMEDSRAAEDAPDASYVWSFDKLLANWEIENHGIFYTMGLDTELKVNIALSLSALGCLVKDSSTCLLCAARDVNQYIDKYCRRIISFDNNTQSLVRRRVTER